MKVQHHCGLIDWFEFEDLSEQPRSVQLMQDIMRLVEYDSLHEHPTSVFFRKGPMIEEYISKAIEGKHSL
jgi:hypothetical protein